MGQITSKVVWDFQQFLMQLAEHNKVQWFWVSDHEGIEGNKMANKLANLGSEEMFTGLEPKAKKVVMDWTNSLVYFIHSKIRTGIATIWIKNIVNIYI
jgi:hypothetical protein